MLKHFKVGGLHAPIVVSKTGGPLGTLEYWNGIGGTNWSGGGYDPENQILFPAGR